MIPSKLYVLNKKKLIFFYCQVYNAELQMIMFSKIINLNMQKHTTSIIFYFLTNIFPMKKQQFVKKSGSKTNGIEYFFKFVKNSDA